MEWFLEFITNNLAYAHWVLFGALILAGLNIPISEDLILVVSGVVASSVAPAVGLKLFIFVFLGAYISDAMAYWIGRRFGPKLWTFSWFRKTVKREKFQRIENLYARYGITTLLIGRFIPFGVRNCLFMTAGMVKMRFLKFLIVDGIACFASNSLVFWLAYMFGRNYSTLMGYLEVLDFLIFGAFIVAVIGFIWYKRAKKAES